MNRFGEVAHYFEKVSSTQDIAKEMAREGADEGTVVVAQEQNRGRGRLGRPWLSPLGGLWFSIILRPPVALTEAPKITLLAAVAVAKAIDELFHLEASIKWPNDILIGGKKVAGILTEASAERNKLVFVVLGTGINANVDVGTFPHDLLMPATALSTELKEEVDLSSLLEVCLKHLEAEYVLFKKKEFGKILDQWRKLSAILGKKVKVSSPAETLVGKASDIDQSGALILQLESGEKRLVQVGDVSILQGKTQR